MKNSIINVKEVENVFKDYCEQNKVNFSKERFEEFLKFLEIDFYDWVRENSKVFLKK